MVRCARLIVATVLSSVPFVAGGMNASASQRQSATKPATPARCAADLGTGVQTQIRFCDVVISSTSREGVVVTVPPRRAPATLRFDLHNRFTVTPAALPAIQVFARHTAVVAVIRPNGSMIDRAAVTGEFRSVNDLFDRISAGKGTAGVKNVGPGKPETVSVSLPTGLASVSIVGVKLEVMTRAGREVFDTPGRPVAIVSNWKIE